MIFRTIAVVGMAAVLAAASPVATLAHGPQGSPGHPMTGQGYMMGPGMMMAPGTMGPGYMMGPGMAGSGMMGPGMMIGPGYMKGPGMMGTSHGYMMVPGVQGCPMQVPDRNLDPDDVTEMLENSLAWAGNKRLKLGKVAAKDDDTILAEIVTVDGSLVEKLAIDRHTGRTTRVE